MKDKRTPGRRRGTVKSIAAKQRENALRPRHVIGEEGSDAWAHSQNAAFRAAMTREYPRTWGSGDVDPDSRPQLVPPAHVEPIGSASSLE